MNKAVLIRLGSLTEAVIYCVEQAADGKTTECGKFTMEISDSAALVTVTRLWLAGVTVEAIANALALGLLPPKVK